MQDTVVPCPRCKQPLTARADPAANGVCSACQAVLGTAPSSAPSMESLSDVPSLQPGAVPAAPGDSAPPPAPSTADSFRFSPAFLAQYQPVRLLGQGGMGAVYLMRQMKLDRMVAIKVIRGSEISADQLQRFVREAKVLAGLNHAHVLALHDIGTDESMPYMVMEFVEGETLTARLRHPPELTLKDCIVMLRRVLSGLQVAHDKGIVHRDLKPDNIFLTQDGKPKIGDFGLARAQHLPSSTAAGIIMGTPPYMSPEMCHGRAVTASCDLYAAGVILFQLVTGELPFRGPAATDYLVQHIRDQPPRARAIAPELPESLDRLIARSLEKDPEARFATAVEFSRALLEVQNSLSPGRGSRARKPGRTKPDAGVMLAERYRMVRQLGAGGMGQVWLAEDQARGGERVALKLLPPELWRDDSARADLVKEANVSLKLAHPNIVRLINLEPGDPPFLVMEYVAGHTLSEELERRRSSTGEPIPPDELLGLIEGLAAGLDFAHSRDVLHRDIKPSNIMLDDGAGGPSPAKLLDFGIAAEIRNLQTRQTRQAPAGTLSYMSPEQVACHPLDARSDVYALAATIYQALSFALPFAGGDVAYAILNEPVPPPPDVPPAIAKVVLAGLAKDRVDRPPSAGAFAEQFRTALAGVPAHVPHLRHPDATMAPGRHAPAGHTLRKAPELPRPRPLCSHPNPPGVTSCSLCSEPLEGSGSFVPRQSGRVPHLPDPSIAPTPGRPRWVRPAVTLVPFAALGVLVAVWNASRPAPDGGGSGVLLQLSGSPMTPPPRDADAALRARWQLLAEAVARNPRNTGACLELGSLALARTEWVFAERLARTALAEHAQDADAHHLVGQALIGLEKWKEAEAAERQSVGFQADRAAARSGLAFALEKLGRQADARQEYQRAIEIDPHDEVARQGLARTAAGP